MNKFIVFCLLILNSAIASAQFAEFSFEDRIKKFEPVKSGVPMSFSFRFSNSGSVPLIISESKVECTCTVVEFPKEPILPGEEGTVKVNFDTKGKMGWQYRKIRLYANTKKKMEEIEFRVKVLTD